MPWRVRRERLIDWRFVAVVFSGLAFALVGVIILYVVYALPPCSLEAEPLLRQLNECR